MYFCIFLFQLRIREGGSSLSFPNSSFSPPPPAITQVDKSGGLQGRLKNEAGERGAGRSLVVVQTVGRGGSGGGGGGDAHSAHLP